MNYLKKLKNYYEVHHSHRWRMLLGIITLSIIVLIIKNTTPSVVFFIAVITYSLGAVVSQIIEDFSE